jgi:hypothetical protein
MVDAEEELVSATIEPEFFNQELSWLQFNLRVLEEALRKETPLLERVRFLSIFFNNLDEFFMVRVSGLIGQLSGGVVDSPPDRYNNCLRSAMTLPVALPRLTRYGVTIYVLSSRRTASTSASTRRSRTTSWLYCGTTSPGRYSRC